MFPTVVRYMIYCQRQLTCESAEHRSGRDHSLCSPCRVEVGPRDEQGLDDSEDVGDVVAGHQIAGVCMRHLCESDGSGDGEAGDNGYYRPPHLDSVCDPD